MLANNRETKLTLSELIENVKARITFYDRILLEIDVAAKKELAQPYNREWNGTLMLLEREQIKCLLVRNELTQLFKKPT